MDKKSFLIIPMTKSISNQDSNWHANLNLDDLISIIKQNAKNSSSTNEQCQTSILQNVLKSYFKREKISLRLLAIFTFLELKNRKTEKQKITKLSFEFERDIT